MASVDDRVVAMSFEKDKFEAGVSSTIGILGRLKQALNFSGAEKGLQDLDAAGQKVNLSHIGNGIDTVKSKFSVLAGAASVALGGIALSAISAGAKLIKSFTLDPIMAGFHNYETQINAVQTIMANTGLKGAAGLKQVNSVLADLNTYANQTVYNFSEMAKNIGTFTAAGVDLKTSAASIKGIANLAALSGSNSDQASNAMYQLSQAIAANQVKLQDWNSVVNAGMGGKVFQSALFNTAEAMGRIKNVKVGETFDQWTQSGNSFRQSLQKGWINADVLTQTLKNFTTGQSDAALKAKGYTDVQIKQIDTMSKTATAAATNIKTVTQLTDALKEEVATAWAAIFKTIFGNITDATSVFSKLHVVLENALTNPIYDLNRLLEGWQKLGGRTDLIDAIKTAWQGLKEVFHAVRLAWEEVFPATTAQQLVDITKHFDDFVHSLLPSIDTISNIRRIFEGVFAVLDIGKTVLGDVIHILEDLFHVAGPAGGGFLSLAANVGDFLVHIDELVKRGNLLQAFFGALSGVLSSPVSLLHTIADAISHLFSGFDPKSSGGVSGALSSLGIQLPSLQKVIDAVENAWSKFTQTLKNAAPIFQPIIQGLQNLFGSLVTFLSNSLQNMNFDNILHAIDTGLLGGIFVLFKKFFTGGGLKEALGGGIFSNINEVLEGVTGNLKAMQQNIKANAILQIGIAVGILAASIFALSTIQPKQLDNALTGLTVAFGELVGALAILNKIGSGTFGALKLDALAAGLILLAGAVALLTISVKELSELDWDQLEKGLTAVGILLAEIVVAVGPISRSSSGMISAGLGIIAISTGIRILASAVGAFGQMSWGEIGKGLAAVAGSLVAIGAAARIFPTGMISLGLGLLAVGGGIRILADAISKLGELKPDQMVQGLVGLAGALTAIAVGMHSMPPGLALQAVGLLLVAEAIRDIAKAVGEFGSLSMDNLAKGILGLALSLTVLGTALNLMGGALPGAAALAVAAGALALLVPAIESLGHQSIGNLVIGMVALASAMGVLGVAGTLLAPVAPAMLALGVAMLAIGGGFALVGAGVFLVGTGLSAIAVSGPIAIGILIKAIENFVTAIPKLVSGIITALTSIVTSLGKAAPQFVTAIGQILIALAQAVIKAAPDVAAAFGAILQNALKVLRDNFPDLISTGLDMLVALLSGIQSHIGAVTTHAIGIITTFLTSIADKLPSIVTSGIHLLTSFLNGIANNLGKVVSSGADVVAHYILGVANNIGKIVSAGVNLLTRFLGAIASGAVAIVAQGANVVLHLITGVSNTEGRFVKAAASAIGAFITEVGKAALNLVDEGAKALINFLNGVAVAIKKYQPQLWNAGWNIMSAIVDGMVAGITNLGGQIVTKIENLIKSLPDKALKLLGIASPSQVFYDIGSNIAEGLANGISDNATSPVDAVQAMTDTMINSIQAFPAAITDALDFQSPTITPVLNLDQLRKEADLIPGYTTPRGLIDLSSGVAPGGLAVSAPGQQTNPDTSSGGDNTGGGAPGVYLTQNNYSPVALSDVEIYRQTNNLVSQISGPRSSYGADTAYVKKTGG